MLMSVYPVLKMYSSMLLKIDRANIIGSSELCNYTDNLCGHSVTCFSNVCNLVINPTKAWVIVLPRTLCAALLTPGIKFVGTPQPKRMHFHQIFRICLHFYMCINAW